MTIPYFYEFEDDLVATFPLDTLPDSCTYPLLFANEKIHHQFKQSDMLSQRLNLKPFLVDLIQLSNKAPLYYNFRIVRDQIFFLFMIQGGVSFSFADGQPITKTKANHFYISHNRPGLYSARTGKGDHIVLVVALHTDWIQEVSKEFDSLKKFVDDFQQQPDQFQVMPHCRMDRQVHLWLREIYTFSNSNTGALDGTLRLYLSLVIEHYHKLLKQRENLTIYRVKEYLEEHFCDHDLGYPKIANVFSYTERTLRNQFQAEFNMTLHGYYTRLRLQKAQYFIENLDKSVKEVYFEVGYNDESSFRYAYNKFVKNIRRG